MSPTGKPYKMYTEIAAMPVPPTGSVAVMTSGADTPCKWPLNVRA